MTRLLPLALAFVVLLTATRIGSAQDQPTPAPIATDGTEIFRWLFHRAGLAPVQEDELFDLRRGGFHDTVVVVLGDTDRRSIVVEPGDRFGGRGRWAMRQHVSPLTLAAEAIRAGGAALIATDEATGFLPHFRSADNGRFGQPPTRVYGGSFSEQDLDRCYLRNTWCPFVAPLPPPPGETGPEWELFAGLDRVATNSPSVLHVPVRHGVFGSSLATFPAGVEIDFGFGGVLVDPEEYPFAAGGSGGHPVSNSRFRFLAVADPSVFINQMLVPEAAGLPPNDNLELTTRVVDFLSTEDGPGPTRKRTKCLFIQNGRVVESLDELNRLLQPPAPPLKLPNPLKLQDKLVDFGNGLLDQMQEKDTLNRTVFRGDEERQNRTLRKLVGTLLVVAAVWAAFAVVRRVWGSRQPSGVPPAPPDGRPTRTDKGDPVPGVYTRRQRELLRRNNLYEPVRAAVREMFLEAGVSPNAGPKLPPVEISEIVRRPNSLRDALSELWKIGFGKPAAVTAQRWDVLEPLFDRARRAYADGKWWFVWDGTESTA